MPTTFVVRRETRSGPWHRPFSARVVGTVQAEHPGEARALALLLWPPVPEQTALMVRAAASVTLTPAEARADAQELQAVGRYRRHRHGAA